MGAYLAWFRSVAVGSPKRARTVRASPEAEGGTQPDDPRVLMDCPARPVRRPAARVFTERVRGIQPPGQLRRAAGAHHDFDLYESIRSAAVNKAAEQFTARIIALSGVNHRDWQPAHDS